MTALHLRIRGTVTSAVCRTTTKGYPLVEVRLAGPAGQQVRARHTYPSDSAASHYAASNLARRLRGQVAELETTNPTFRAHRIDCDAAHITLPFEQPISRKDLE